MNFKKLPIGIDNFKEVRDIKNNYYYVDKTLFIKELLERRAAANLITRPRCFGSSLNMSMLQYFFDITKVKDSDIFDGLNIMSEDKQYLKHMNMYPVISITLKEATGESWDLSYESIKREIAREFKRCEFILQDVKLSDSKEKYKRIQSGMGDKVDYSSALYFLTKCLHIHYEEDVIVLIDDYDVVLENAATNDFYNEAGNFIQSVLGYTCKDNKYLEFAVITGCFYIQNESIITGSNLHLISIMSSVYAECFGFTEKEVLEMLEYYNLSSKSMKVKELYDGYIFGDTKIYNPLSIISYVYNSDADINDSIKPYLINIYSNSVIKREVEDGKLNIRRELECLINGGEIEEIVDEYITYNDWYKTDSRLWNLLFFAGYLKKVKQEYRDDRIYVTLKIPNEEVRTIYKGIISEGE